MLSKVTLLAATAYPQSGSAAFLPLTVEDEYIINTKNITRLKVYSTTDTELTYLFGDGERCAKATLRVDEAYSVHVANAIAVAKNNIIALTVKINELGQTLSSSETWYVNQDKIFLAYDYKTDYTKVWISKGGGNYEAIVVEEDLDEIIALADSGS
jgi:hypothetical protein